MTSRIRPWVLAAVVVAVLWSGSMMAPWAAGPRALPWLEDAVYYARFASIAWAVAETLYWARHRRHRGSGVLPPLVLAWAALAAWMLAGTGAGLDLRAASSTYALSTAAQAAPHDVRRRAGLLLVDTARRPCRGQAWLWLGRPFGAGTGTNMALVDAGGGLPATPIDDAFVFRHATGRWWMAYQQPGRYQRALAAGRERDPGACTPGMPVSSHGEGVDFIAGRYAPLQPPAGSIAPQ